MERAGEDGSDPESEPALSDWEGCFNMLSYSASQTPLTFKRIRSICKQQSLMSFAVYAPRAIIFLGRRGADAIPSLFEKENFRGGGIRTYLQFVLIKPVLHLQAPISCWCLFSFAIYFIPAAPPCPLNTLPTFSKRKINRLEVT